MKKFTTTLFALSVPFLLVGAIAQESNSEEQEHQGEATEQTNEDRFSALDRNDDDEVSRREFIGHYLREQPTDEEGRKLQSGLAQRFERMDSNGDEKLTLEEFVKARQPSDGSTREGDNTGWFDAVDSDDNDEVSLEEFTNGFKRRLKNRAEADEETLVERLTQRFERMDSDSDGVVSRDEMPK